MSQIASTSSVTAPQANFMDPITAANAESVNSPTSAAGIAQTQSTAAAASTPSKPGLKFTISVNQGQTTASTVALPSTSGNGNGNGNGSLVSSSNTLPSSPAGNVSISGPSLSGATPSPTRFVIVNKRNAATNAPSASSTTQLTASQTSTSVSPSIPATNAEGQLQSSTSDSSNMLQLNATKPLEKSSPALLAMAAASIADSPTASSRKLATIESASEVDVPLPSNLPSNHPAAFARPPTPPTPNIKSKSRRSRSRTQSVSPAMRGRRGSDSTTLPPHLQMGMSPLGSARDTFKLPGSAVISPRESVKVDKFNPLLDGGETEFSQALRAALAEAGTVASPSEGATASLPTEVLSPRNKRIDDENPSASRTPADANSSNVTPTEEATERELRKQAIRQKNAMHMRIRNAGAAPAASHSRAPSVNRAAIAAAAAAAGSSSAASDGKSGSGVMRSNTFNPSRSHGNSNAGALQMAELSSLPSMIVEGQESKLLANTVQSDLNVIVPSDPTSSPVKRTRSSILKNPLPNVNPSPTSTNDEPVTRTRSGIMRIPSLKTGSAVMTTTDNASAKNAPADKGVVRTGTVNSRVGFVVPIGEGNDTDSSSSSSDDETAPKPKRLVDADATAESSVAPASPSHNRGSQFSAGIPSLHATKGDGRTHIFMKQGSQLVLTSVSAAGNHSNQAANVMVMSVSSIFTRLRLYTDLCFFLSMIGVVLTIVNKELHYAYPNDSTVDTVITVIRFLTSASTIALIGCLYQYYKADFQFLQLNRVYLLRSAVWNTQLISRFVLEVLICVIHEPPFLHHDVDMSISDTATIQSLSFEGKTIIEPVIVRNPWSLLVVARIYFVLRLVLSRYYTGGTKILGLWFNFNFNIPFAIRNMLYSHPMLSLAPVVGILIFSCSYSLWVFEREVPDRHFSFGTALWVVCITLTSVGYGDITPMSSGGRAICILSAFLGIMVTAVLVAAVHQKLTLLPYEGRMVEFLERDSNSSLLKYYASRCISRSWKYYHYRKKCVRLVAEREFTFVSRSNLLRYKTTMLQGIFDFQTARKQIQAYDRRYHSEQLFRSMLEGLYDKLEAMTLDFHVLEDEFDISYEEQRKLGHKQSEILEEVKNLAKLPAISEAPTATDATPEKGRLSLLRTTSMPVNTSAVVGSEVVPALPAPALTRPPSEVNSVGVSGRQSADDGGISLSDQVRHTRHKSLKHVRMSEDASEGDGDSHAHHLAHHHAHFHPDTQALAAAGAANAPSPSPAIAEASKQPRSILMNPKRASTLGGLDLTAAVNAASEKAAAAAVAASASGAPAPLNAIRARSSGDLLSHVVIETPAAHPLARNADTPTSGFLPTLARRTSTTSTDVTADLLSVVQALSSPATNPSDASAGRTRFGESDFAAHRAAAAVKSNRRTVVLPRGQTLLQGSATPAPDTKEVGIHRLNNRQSSIGDGLGNIVTPILLQQSSVPHHHSTASDDRTHSPTGANKPHFPRTPSSGTTLRVAAATRAASHAHANSEQMDKLMMLLVNVSDRLATLETKLARPAYAHHPHSHSQSVHAIAHSAQASPLSLASNSTYQQGFESQPISQPTTNSDVPK